MAVAVFARFTRPSPPYSTAQLPENLWLAVREICTCPHERENRRSVSLKWVPYVEFAAFVEHWSAQPGNQVLEPKREFKCEDSEDKAGLLDVEKVWRVWSRDVGFDKAGED